MRWSAPIDRQAHQTSLICTLLHRANMSFEVLCLQEMHFDKFLNPSTFQCWKTSFKTEVCSCSKLLTDATLWIKEVEIVDSVDDLKTFRSIGGHRFPNFEILDAKNASALKKIIPNPYFKKRVSLEEQKAQMQDRFLEHIKLCLIAQIYSVSLSMATDIYRWEQALLSTSELPKDTLPESL